MRVWLGSTNMTGHNYGRLQISIIGMGGNAMRNILCGLLFLVSTVSAEAVPKKNWYLRIDNGAGGDAYVFKNKAACEAAGQRMLKTQRQIDRMPRTFESKYRWSNPRCLNRLPYGYLPPA